MVLVFQEVANDQHYLTAILLFLLYSAPRRGEICDLYTCILMFTLLSLVPG